jgi:putative glycosyl hydrolase-like family 6 (GHL6) protein
MFLTILLFLTVTASAAERWWLDEPVRLIQTNLREIDARDFDVEVYVNEAKAHGANTVLINVGGIVANYPTELEFHYGNPYLKFDMIGEVVKRLHEEKIRVIGRFDFSKINEKFAAQNPEWLYRSVAGKEVNYNGQVHTCVNGDYQQDYLFKILTEAIDKYPLDGIFFNMIGYQTRDYSRNYHGICQSNACKRRFKEWSNGLTLPTTEDMEDPDFRQYQKFKDFTSNELFYRVHDHIQAKRPDIAICTYTHGGVDLIRRESASHIWDERPAFNYHSTDNVKRDLGSYPDKQVANTAVHFVDIPFRHSSVSPHLAGIRLIEDILAGAILDYYMIGRLDNQDDRVALHVVKDIYNFHAENEKYFYKLTSPAEVLLVDGDSTQETRGMLRMLAQEHIVFDMMEASRLADKDTPRPLEDYKLVVLADAASLSDAACERLDAFVQNGGKILATGGTSTRDEIGGPQNRFRLQAAGVQPQFTLHQKARATYLRIFREDKNALGAPESFNDLDILYVWGDFLEFKLQSGAAGHLGLIPAAMYGPPEKCYYTNITRIPGLIANEYGKGRFAYLPWPVGAMYEHRSHHGHRATVNAAIRNVLNYSPPIEVEASPLVEVAHQSARDGSFEWIGLANHTGQLGTAFHAPVPMRNVTVRYKTADMPRSARLLRSNQTIKTTVASDGALLLTIPELSDFEVVVLE